MQRDFHYCVIKYLALKAGFKESDAEIIGYASQYVDDATEHKEIRVKNLPAPIRQRAATVGLIKNGNFDPVCTAHKGIQYTFCKDPDVQKKVYISFHFIPTIQSGAGGVQYTVKKGGPLARKLVEDAIRFYYHAEPGTEKKQGLVKIGIALHSYADTWSHRDFSGRWNPAVNGVSKVRVREMGKWKAASILKTIATQVAPSIGHARAYKYPDRSDLVWRYWKGKVGPSERSNTDGALQAAEYIYTLLCWAKGMEPHFSGFKAEVRSLLAQKTSRVEEKIDEWNRRFGDPKRFVYDPKEWREKALTGDTVDWDEFLSEEDFHGLTFSAKKNPLWFLFHIEASKQRKAVMAHL